MEKITIYTITNYIYTIYKESVVCSLHLKLQRAVLKMVPGISRGLHSDTQPLDSIMLPWQEPRNPAMSTHAIFLVPVTLR